MLKKITQKLVLCLFLILIYLCGSIIQTYADELGKFEGQFKKKQPNPQGEDVPDVSTQEGCVTLLDCIFGSIFKGSSVDFKNQEKFLLHSYPYESNINNYLIVDGIELGRHYAYTFSPVFQSINPNTNGYSLNFDYRYYYRFGFTSDYIHYIESSAHQTSQLDFYSLYFFIVPSESNNVIFDSGLGGMVLSGNDHFLGPAVTLRWTIFPQKPIVIKTHISLGGFNWIPIWDLGAEIGLMTGPVEFYLGYRTLVGPDADLSGPLGGIRYWF